MSTGDHMPVQWPGNSVTKLAEPNGQGGYRSPIATADGQTIWGDYFTIDQPAATLFSDDFATGDLSHVEGSAEWIAQRATSLVSGDGCVVFSSSGAVLDPPTCGFESRQWEGFTNNISMRFRYGIDSAFPMQEWTLGAPATRVRDIWFRFPYRVPQEYAHVNNSGSSVNNKFFALWMDGRETNSDQGATVVFQTYPVPGDQDLGSVLKMYIWYSSVGNGDQGGAADFFSVPATAGNGVRDDRLRWMEIVFRMKANDAGTGTGKIQSWRRWQDESNYTLMHSVDTDVPIPNSGYDGWNRVQIMGGDNSWLADGTEVLMDGFYVSESPLVPAGTEGL